MEALRDGAKLRLFRAKKTAISAVGIKHILTSKA